MNVGMRPGTRTILLVTAIALVASVAAAQENSGIAGKWRGEGDWTQGAVVIVQFQQDETGRWIGTTKSNRDPDNVRDLEAVNVEGSRVTYRLTVEGPAGTVTPLFDLRRNPVSDELRGTVSIRTPGGDMELPMTLTRVVERADSEGISYLSDRPLAGSWSAIPDKKDKTREIQVDLLTDANAYKGTITDTGIDATVPLKSLDVKDNDVVSFLFRFEGAPFMSSFWGRYDEVKDELRGSMSIGGRSQPLKFARTSQGPDDVDDDFTTNKEPLPIKHPGRFAVTARGALWQPLYVLKEKNRNINDITSSKFAFDGGVRFYIIDFLAIQARYARGGLGFDTNETNLGLFDHVTGPQGEGMSASLSTDSEISMDGFEFSFVGYLGQNILPKSKFNPYLIGLVGKTNWELTEAGRGTDVIEIFEKPVEGTDWTFGGGLGTEYAVSERFGLELEWLWAYTTTADETEWDDITYQWTNQHVYRLSLGGVFWF